MFSWMKMLLSRIRGSLGMRRTDEEFSQELGAHLEMLTAENIRRGMVPEQAQRAARMKLGGATQLRETNRQLRGLPLIETFLADIRYAVRTLRKSPGFALVCVLTLALGIGANTAIFTVINAVLIRPVPGVRNPGELVTLERLQKNNPDFVFGYPDYLDYRDQNQSFAGLAGRCRTPLTLTQAKTERIVGELVSGNYFSVFGVNPSLGRLIGPADVQADDESPVAVLSYGIWQRIFGSDPSVIGKNIQLNGHRFTIVGVAAREFSGTVVGSPTEVWVPLTMQPAAIPRMARGILHSRFAGWVQIFGRLKHGVRLEEARSEMQGIAGRLAVEYPNSNEHRGVDLIGSFGMDPDDRAALEKFFVLLLASVGLLLLISCSNVANLLLSRADSRRREIAVRLALGASPGRLIRQLLTEGVLLASLAGGLGLLLAPWTASLIVSFRQPLYTLHDVETTPDLRVLVFTLAVAILTGVLSGLAPALQSSKRDLIAALKDNTPGAGRRSKLRGVLVSSQIALSLVLLIAAGVTVRHMQKIVNQDPGFTTNNLLLMSTSPSVQGYSEPQGARFYQELLPRLQQIPGIQSASLAATVPPIDWSSRVSIFYEGQAPPREYLAGHEFELGIRVDINTVAPNYFRTMGISVLQGRDFTEQDRDGTPLVAVISERLAQRLWPKQNPLGRRFEWPSTDGPPRLPIEIIGIASDAKYRSLMADPPLLLYLPLFQNYNGTETILLRTPSDPASFLPAVRAAIASLDARLPVYGVKTISDQVADSLWQQRMAGGLLGSFSFLALVLAGIGLYAVVSHWMRQRTREIGVRMALGAQPKDVILLILRHGAALAGAGMATGILASVEVTRIVSGLLFGASGTDVWTVLAIAALLALVALAACYVPARRALRIDPIAALRYE